MIEDYSSLLKTRLSEVLRTTNAHLSALKDLRILTIEDFYYYFPKSYRDERDMVSISQLSLDQVNVVQGTLAKLLSRRTKTNKIMTSAWLGDDTGAIEVLWFNQPHIQRLFRNGDEVILTGKIKYNGGRIYFPSPKYEIVRQKQLHSARLVPCYHEHGPITSKWIREKINPILKGTAFLPDPLPEKIIENEHLMSYGKAIRTVHDPHNEEELKQAKERLAFDELFQLHLIALKRRQEFRNKFKNTERVVTVSPENSREFILALPFELTGAQKKVIEELTVDLGLPYPMSRLIQGDVGSGKTVVAAFALYHVIKSGFQGALMAPTEILVRQHYHTLLEFLGRYHFNIQMLTGSLVNSVKRDILRQIASGTVDIVVGTQAIIQENVSFKKLGLAVIDEQHRFGVRQRELLQKQGSPHVLNLSATPIPRTLAMVLYGDQDVSILDELPPGRQEIITRLVPEEKRVDAERWIADQINKGRQIFIICPLIDESDVLGVKAVTVEYERLSTEVFREFTIGLLHGKLATDEKEHIMSKFKNGEINILVSTSVVEVGIDVPNATIMLIEGAERFGLSQLHQFRGRVGRGAHQSYCFLFTNYKNEVSLKRLKAMCEYASGFRLAEIDLASRGPGEIYGVRQSGIPDLKMASWADGVLLQRVHRAAYRYVAELGIRKITKGA
ncbi:MAG: ATP-dependent DNA helicase RecG, ATP-dependent DNA helicase RecG [Candidatus Peregrinibacteria bacterium GW2011_GWE2_39_6]|nr:MAG: ATP-dependent DNA helicase RecG, ATP-dependent DNA helicase RecG [Candidatus Peregrinibacteria bacterium GW2011_GWF2_39_17]KKR25824.1 MAG: ATP-dependent DNA helicase RecG, ATP-dependent DNA helicase RecG [Candidatus Peregrinibacteria bacterium GW2011_GWE2_39_6]HCW32271.1 DNA helicase RecG [Candidatus Peregrinibacteria bacterium]